MALLMPNLPGAVSGIVSAIAEGVELSKDLVDRVDFPEKVVFDIEAITRLNHLRRESLTTIGPSSKTTSEAERRDVEKVYRDGVLNQINVTTVSPTQRLETTGPELLRRSSFEDEAVRAVFEYPGPNYRPSRNAVAAG